MSNSMFRLRELASTRAVQDDRVEEEEELDRSEEDDSDSSEGSETSSASGAENSSRVRAVLETQISPDGTCILTTHRDQTLQVWPTDVNNLASSGLAPARPLSPYATLSSSGPIWAFATSPKFDVFHGEARILVSTRDQYINLYDALGAPSDDLGPRKISTKLASYKLVNENTEEVTAPLSLAFTDQGSQFVAGTRNTISIFDINHPGEPITFIRTIPDGYKGVVTSLGVSPASTVSRSGILAAGTRNRQIGLYESEGYGQLITRFNLPGSLEGANPGPRAVTKPAAWLRDPMEERMGNGVTQLKWSACGNYLYIAEGMSDTILIYDIRNYTMAVGFCVGRNAMTTQKLGFDHFHGHEGQEVWAGDMEGNVRLWRNPHQFGGPINADHEYGRAVEAEVTTEVGFDPVVSTLVLYGNYLVTAQGVVNGTEDRGCVSIHGFDLVG